MALRTLRDVVTGKTLAACTAEMTVLQACELLNRHNVGAMPVMDGEHLVGIFSERDVIRRVLGQGKAPETTSVGEVMTPKPQTIDATGSLADALDRMERGHFRHMPVTEMGRVIGMISMRDIPAEIRDLVSRWREYRTTAAVAAE